MKTQPSTPEMARFNDALRQVLSVSKSELNRRMEADRQSKAGRPKRGPKPKTSVSGHASFDKD
ncbi:MAG TPA: hypothetical protein VMD58_06990 [Acidobacteriaceae bacterium]|nr:hypothetical protein [Acidobacteriaceae bacterium]